MLNAANQATGRAFDLDSPATSQAYSHYFYLMCLALRMYPEASRRHRTPEEQMATTALVIEHLDTSRTIRPYARSPASSPVNGSPISGSIPMARPRKSTRVYKRGDRYYGDFRGLGGGREPLIPSGEKLATTDRDIAEYLAKLRAQQLELATRRRSGVVVPATLGAFASEHLVRKAQRGNIGTGWLARTETRLGRALGFFGADRELDAILPADVERWILALSEMQVGRGGRKTMSPGTMRHHLNALSNLYQRAIIDGRVPTGYNPVAALLDKPSANTEEARWLEVHEAALLLEAARCY